MTDLEQEFNDFQERINEMLDKKIQDACLDRMESVDSEDDSDEADQ